MGQWKSQRDPEYVFMFMSYLIIFTIEEQNKLSSLITIEKNNLCVCLYFLNKVRGGKVS